MQDRTVQYGSVCLLLELGVPMDLTCFKCGGPHHLKSECSTWRTSDSDALAHMFTLLRTGMQWRELNSSVHCTTVLRRFHDWKRLGVFEQAYRKACLALHRCTVQRYAISLCP